MTGFFFIGLSLIRYLTEALHFLSEAEITTVSEAWYDIFLFVHALVDRSAPDR